MRRYDPTRSFLGVTVVEYFVDPPNGPYETGTLYLEGHVFNLDEAHDAFVKIAETWGLRKHTRLGATGFRPLNIKRVPS